MATAAAISEHLLKLSPDLLDTVCSKEHLLKLTKHFSEWIKLSTYLKLTRVQQEDIEYIWPRDLEKQKIEMFSAWMNNMGNKATYR